MFVDLDDITLGEKKKRLRASGLPEPTLTVASGHGVPCYWRLAEPISDRDEWQSLQQRLVVLLGGDRKVTDWPLVMRVGGFLNYKREPPVLCEVSDANPFARCKLATIEELLPEMTTEPTAETPRPTLTGDEDRYAQAMRYIAACPGATEGAGDGTPGRNDSAYQLAATLVRDFALTSEQALVLVQSWNVKNRPPLDPDELEACLRNATRCGTRDVGVKIRPQRRALTDTGNGERFADQHWGRLRHIKEVGRWAVYDGRRWNVHTGDEHAVRAAIETARRIPTRLRALRTKRHAKPSSSGASPAKRTPGSEVCCPWPRTSLESSHLRRSSTPSLFS